MLDLIDKKLWLADSQNTEYYMAFCLEDFRSKEKSGGVSCLSATARISQVGKLNRQALDSTRHYQ